MEKFFKSFSEEKVFKLPVLNLKFHLQSIQLWMIAKPTSPTHETATIGSLGHDTVRIVIWEQVNSGKLIRSQ